MREALLHEESKKRDTLAQERDTLAGDLSEAQDECGRLQSKIELLQGHSHKSAVKISRLEQELAIFRRSSESQARAVFDQQMGETGSSLHDSSRPLPPSPPNDQDLNELEEELLSDALSPLKVPKSPAPPAGVSRSMYSTHVPTRSTPSRPSSSYSSPYSNVDRDDIHRTLPAVPPLT